MQSRIFYPRQFPDRPIGHIPDTAERSQDRGLHVAEECSDTRWLIQVLQDYNSWRRHLKDAVPPLVSIVVETRDWRFAGAKTGGSCVSHQGREIFKNAGDASVSETGIPQSELKSLDRVRDQARV